MARLLPPISRPVRFLVATLMCVGPRLALAQMEDDDKAVAPPSSVAEPPATAPQGAPASTQSSTIDPDDADAAVLPQFEKRLEPYGAWVDDAVYGRVWIADPRYVGDDFAPYVTGGHWGLTEDQDWIWRSEYPFGGVVFHYGRWVWLSKGRWGWVPGGRYAHAWVDYRVPETTGAAYLGWSPAPPRWVWRGGVAVSLSSPPPRYYVFVPSAYVFYRGLPRYVLTDGFYLHYAYGHTLPYYAPFGYYPYYWGAPRLRVHHTHAGGRRVTVGRAPSLSRARIPLASTPRASSGSPAEIATRRTRAGRVVGVQPTSGVDRRALPKPAARLKRPVVVEPGVFGRRLRRPTGASQRPSGSSRPLRRLR